MASGKTTLAQHLCDSHNFQKFSLATKVKQIAIDICGMDPKQKDRALLQKIGHEMRRILSEDVWVEAILKDTKDVENAVIDDVRYANELIALKKDGWRLVKINISPELQKQRIMKAYPTSFQQHLDNLEHPSETNLDTINVKAFDFSINMGSTHQTENHPFLVIDKYILRL